MGTVRKIGDDYYVEFVARGLTYQRNGGKDKAAALRLLKEIEDQIRKGETGLIVHDERLSGFIKELQDVLNVQEDPRTVERYRCAIGHFRDFCVKALGAQARMSQITPRLIEDYRLHLSKAQDARGRPMKPALMNFTLFLLKDILDRAINFGHINDNPMRHVRFFAAQGARRCDVLSPSAEEYLREQGLGGPLTVLMGSGMALDELMRLNWTNVDLKKNCLTIESKPGSTRRSREVPLGNALRDVFRDQDRVQGRKRTTVFEGKLLKRLAHESKLIALTRNTFAKEALVRGVSLIGLNKLMGFRDIARVGRYAAFLKN